MSENKILDLTEGGSSVYKIVPYLRLTVSENIYTLSALITVPSNYAVGTCAVTSSGDAVTVDIPVTGSGSPSSWKAVLRTCTLPSTGSGITSASMITVNMNESITVTGEVGGGDPPPPSGSSQVTYEDAEDE